MKKAVYKLPPQDVELVTMVYYNGLTLKDYAEKNHALLSGHQKKRARLNKAGEPF